MSEINSAEINANIDHTVDSMLVILKKQLLSPGGFEKRGIWDRFKNWMSNIWHGRYGQKNPYYFINTLGDFTGAKAPEPKKESYIPHAFTLHEYAVIKGVFDQLEKSLETFNEADMSNVENIRLMRILDDWSKQLKIALKSLIASQEKAKPEIKEEPEKSECEKLLDQKHKDGKISPADFTKIKGMISSGNLPGACAELQRLLAVSEATPKETEETTPKATEETPPKPTETERPSSKKSWPLNHGNTKEDFENIQSELADESKPNFENSYKSRMSAFIASAQSGNEEAKEQHDKLKKIRIAIRDLINGGQTESEEMQSLMMKYKHELMDIMKDYVESDEDMTFESSIKPYHGFSLKEKTSYLKKLLNRV